MSYSKKINISKPSIFNDVYCAVKAKRVKTLGIFNRKKTSGTSHINTIFVIWGEVNRVHYKFWDIFNKGLLKSWFRKFKNYSLLFIPDDNQILCNNLFVNSLCFPMFVTKMKNMWLITCQFKQGGYLVN